MDNVNFGTLKKSNQKNGQILQAKQSVVVVVMIGLRDFLSFIFH